MSVEIDFLGFSLHLRRASGTRSRPAMNCAIYGYQDWAGLGTRILSRRNTVEEIE